MIYTIIYEYMEFGQWLQESRSSFNTLAEAEIGLAGINKSLLKHGITNKRAWIDPVPEDRILGNCEFCDEPVVDGDEGDDKTGRFRLVHWFHHVDRHVRDEHDIEQ